MLVFLILFDDNDVGLKSGTDGSRRWLAEVMLRIWTRGGAVHVIIK